MSWVHRIHSIFSASAALLLLLTSSCSALSTPSKQAIASPSRVASSTAAILNVNARSVSPPLIALTREVLGEENVHVTSTAEEARSAAQRVVERGHSLVIPMGGDGTLSGWIDRLVEEVMRRDAIHGRVETVEDAFGRLPVIGYVPRGTGNGLGHVVGCYQVNEDYQTANTNPKPSFLSRINPLSRRKLKRRDNTKRLLLRLKEVGDLLQQQQQTLATPNGSKSVTQSKAELEELLSDKCTIVEMPMMQIIHQEDTITDDTTDAITSTKGDLCFFAGSGFDSLMLHDFQQIKAWSSTSKTLPTFLKDALSSVAGYCVALVTLTLPQTLRYGTHKIRVRVTTEDEGALWIDHRRGDFAELAVRRQKQCADATNDSIDHGSINSSANNTQTRQRLLFSGTTGIVAASTTPYYGGGLRLFPYARLIPNKLQLRLGRISPLVGFFNIPKIFEGSYREKSDSFGCLDFVGEEFDVEVSSPVYEEYMKRRRNRRGGWWRRIWGKARNEEEKGVTTNGEKDVTTTSGFPFQHSGESMGIKERFKLRVVKQPVRFVTFLRPRVVVDK